MFVKIRLSTIFIIILIVSVIFGVVVLASTDVQDLLYPDVDTAIIPMGIIALRGGESFG